MNKFDPNLGLIWSRPRTLAGGLVLAALLTARPASAGLFRSTGAMNTGRDLHTATLLTNGKVLVVGGRSTGTNYLASAELYDLATGTWSFTGPLNKARASHTATLLPNGKVLIAGGFSNSNPDGTGWSPMPDCELYDPDTGTWSLTGALNIPHDGHSATLLPNGKVLAAGGNTSVSNRSTSLDVAESYDPATGTWALTGAMYAARTGHTATLLGNGKVLVAAGNNESTGQLNLAELYDPATGTWSPTGTLSQNRGGHTATLLPNGWVLVAGGVKCCAFGTPYSLSTAELYDPVSGTWTTTASLNIARSSHTAILLPTGRVVASGGLLYDEFDDFFPLPTTEEYDPSSGKWSSSGSMAIGRVFHTATLMANGIVLVVGGADDSSRTLSSAELYNSQSGGNWTQTESMLTARWDPRATVLTNGQVLVAGAWNGLSGLTYLSSAEKYDPASATWTATASMNSPRTFHTATLLQNGQVLAAGGFDGANSVFAAELYDPEAGSWTVTGWLNEARGHHTATLLQNGQVLVAGGSSTTMASAELYDDATGIWTPTGPMNRSRQDHTSTLLADGRVLAAGGLYFDGLNWVPLDEAELYDPATGIWTPTRPMTIARAVHTATLLANGKVLVAGGEAYSSNYLNFFASAELYDPATETWTTTGSMAIGRSKHTATLLLDGKVLVAGGLSLHSSPFSLSSSELYDPASGVWAPASPLNTGRSSHATVRLANGDILAVGGESHNISPYSLASAELYRSSATNGQIPQAITLIRSKLLANGSFQFAFTNTPGAVFSVLTTTNPALPIANWTVLGGVTELSPGHFEFTDVQANNHPERFYRVRSP